MSIQGSCQLILAITYVLAKPFILGEMNESKFLVNSFPLSGGPL